MIVSTVLSLLVVPILYIVIAKIFCRFKGSCKGLSSYASNSEANAINSEN